MRYFESILGFTDMPFCGQATWKEQVNLLVQKPFSNIIFAKVIFMDAPALCLNEGVPQSSPSCELFMPRQEFSRNRKGPLVRSKMM